MGTYREARTPYWSPHSQSHAPAHILVQYLQLGWTPNKVVTIEVIHYGSHRQTKVYHFVLLRGVELLQMPVVETPVVPRLIRKYSLLPAKAQNLPSRVAQPSLGVLVES